MQPNKIRVVGLSCLIAVLGLTGACGGETEPVREVAVRPVKMMTVESASNLLTSQFPAVVDAGEFAELSFQVGGRIEEVAVVEAQEIEQGDLIARLDQRDFQSQLSSARAQFQNAEEEYQRAVRLAEQDAIARSVLEQRETQRDVARAQLDSAEKALEDSTLVAPFSGVVAQVPIRETQTIPAGQLAASVIGLGDLEVSIDLPARLVAASQEIENRGATVTLEAAPETPIPAVFKEANLVADTASQTYGVTFTFEPPENLVILPGMNATVEISGTRRNGTGTEGRISVPLAAVSSDGSQNFVWIVHNDTMTVSRREVTVADSIGESVVVTGGLVPGETIASAGASFLADGMEVRPWTE